MHKNITVILLFVFSITFFSCEKGIDLISEDSNVYLPLSGYTEQTVLLGESIFELGVYKSGINQSNSDVTVDFVINEQAFNEFKALNPAYELMPEGYFDLSSASVTIPSGQVREELEIHLKGIDESFVDKNYVLPLSIENVHPSAGILEEQKTVLINFSRYRNVYEHLYKAYGTKVTAGSEDSGNTIDEEVYATTVSANTIKVKGAENNLFLHLTIQGNKVLISGAEGSERYDVKNTEGKTSSYQGSFDSGYQSNKGTFNLFYSYTLNGQEINVEVELKFWL